MPRTPQTYFVTAEFGRPELGPAFVPEKSVLDCPFSGAVAWQSNGGPHRGHPARSLPFSMEARVDPDNGQLFRIHLLGVFALHSAKNEESAGTLGASIQLNNSRDTVFRQDLLNGRHYRDARDLSPLSEINGDGTSLRTVGVCELAGAPARVDVFTIDIPPELTVEFFRFKDLGSPASFVLFDVLFEHELGKGCPFHVHSGGISLGEIGSSIRIGDRVKFSKALEQMEVGILSAEDLDEARGEALTFLAVVTAATIEIGGTREMHRALLESAREFDAIDSIEGIAEAVKRRADVVAALVFKEIQGPSSYLVDRALAMVERNYAKNLTDASVAATLGLSTSHFRYLFRETTGQPFHKFLVSLRLEKARQMLVEQEIAVSVVAKAVGFAGLSHFSRAFTQRFQVSPTSIRRSVE
jgi:AraC-like DNA-binding protein